MEDDIRYLDPRDHVRTRPNMYFIGGTGTKGLHQLIFELVENSIDQVLRGFCQRIQVTLQDGNRVTVTDNGAGIPIATFKDTGKSFLERVLTYFGEWPQNWLEREVRTFGGGSIGLFLAIINATCAELTAQVKRDGFLWEQRFQAGVPQGELIQVRPLAAGEETGTSITLVPDFTVFDRNEFSYETLYHRLREIAFLTSSATIILEDQRTPAEGPTVEFHFPGGLADYVAFLNRDYQPLHPPVSIRETIKLKKDYKPTGEMAEIEIAFQYSDAVNPILFGYVNAFNITGGGTHIKGFLSGARRSIHDYLQKTELDKNWPWSDPHEYDFVAGLTVVISLWHPQPTFEGSMLYKLMNPEMEDAVRYITMDAFEQFAEQYPDAMRQLAERCLATKQAREQRRYGL
ncbi:MAG TPA: ATP-binding protein [Phototrophicaceae bacterium]|nr:ATP-binding protein [Phototrophicaceae bacterium]